MQYIRAWEIEEKRRQREIADLEALRSRFQKDWSEVKLEFAGKRMRYNVITLGWSPEFLLLPLPFAAIACAASGPRVQPHCEDSEAEEKQLEGQREVLQKAQVKRKRYEGNLAYIVLWVSDPIVNLIVLLAVVFTRTQGKTANVLKEG